MNKCLHDDGTHAWPATGHDLCIDCEVSSLGNTDLGRYLYVLACGRRTSFSVAYEGPFTVVATPYVKQRFWGATGRNVTESYNCMMAVAAK